MADVPVREAFVPREAVTYEMTDDGPVVAPDQVVTRDIDEARAEDQPSSEVDVLSPNEVRALEDIPALEGQVNAAPKVQAPRDAVRVPERRVEPAPEPMQPAAAPAQREE